MNTRNQTQSRERSTLLHHTRVLWATGLGLILYAVGCEKRPPANAPAATNAATSAASAPQPTPPRVVTVVPLTNMVAVKAGTFQRVRFPVTLTKDYWIARTEVTQGEYESVMGRNPSHFKGDSNRPVEKVSFLDALAYCNAITRREREAGHLPDQYLYRLPTEAEWEFACRAGTTNRYSFGDADDAITQYGWTTENAEGTTHPVAQKLPNPLGLYDMHGNVWEWCLDWFADYPQEPETDPVGPVGGMYKIFRGGSWNHDNPFARSGNRFMMSPSNGIHFVGFRLALGTRPPAPTRPAQLNQPKAPKRGNNAP